MSAKKIITVFGATGSQGGGLVRAIANDPDSEFIVRAVTRDPDSEKAKELSSSAQKLFMVICPMKNQYTKHLKALMALTLLPSSGRIFLLNRKKQRPLFLQKRLRKSG